MKEHTVGFLCRITGRMGNGEIISYKGIVIIRLNYKIRSRTQERTVEGKKQNYQRNENKIGRRGREKR